MARTKRKVKETVTEFEEGDREPGEGGPPMDDSHLAAQSQVILGDEVPDDDPIEPTSDSRPTDQELVEMTVGSETVKVSPEAAQVYNDEITRLTNLATTNVELEPDVVSEETSGEDLATEILMDPAKVLADFGDKLEKKIKGDLSTAYTIEEKRRLFWEDFYGENPDLKNFDNIVHMVLSANMGVLEGMVGKSGRDRLSTLTKEEILRVSSAQRGLSLRKRSGSTSLEGGTGGGQEAPAKNDNTEEEAPSNIRHLTLGNAIKARRLKRHSTQRQEQ